MNIATIIRMLLISSLWSSTALSNESQNTAAALKAMSDYLKAMDQFYVTKQRQANVHQDKVNKEQTKKNKELLVSELNESKEALNGSIAAYEKALELTDSLNDKLALSLNLAIAYFKRNELQQEESLAMLDLEKSIAHTQLLIDNKPRAAEGLAATYLKSMSLERLGRGAEARSILRSLAKTKGKSKYIYQANIRLGDDLFNKGEPKAALKYFRASLKSIDMNSTTASNSVDRLQVSYRLAWASYKAADLEQAVKSANIVLTSRAALTIIIDAQTMIVDAAELMADSLFELNRVDYMSKILTADKMQENGGHVAYYLMKRMNKSQAHDDIIKLGAIVRQRFAKSPIYPQTMDLLASSYLAQDKQRSYLSVLEQIALLLPERSLWRRYNLEDQDALSKMESVAEGAARMLAAHYYDAGSKTGARNSLQSAAQYLQLLVDNRTTSADLGQWKLRHANAQFLLKNYETATKNYAEIIENTSFSADLAEVAMYQAAETHYRHFYQLIAGSTDKKALKAPKVYQGKIDSSLQQLEASTLVYADRFPEKERAYDLLLSSASAYREVEQLNKSSIFWQRILAGSSSPMQRAASIRGMLYASLTVGTLDRTIDLAQLYLDSEKWKQLGKDLEKETLSVLSKATEDYASKEKSGGNIKMAGSILVKVAQRNHNLPRRDDLLRTGAYYMAMAGDWNSAQFAAKWYQDAKLKKNWADMRYLEARSLEQQMIFGDAAEMFLEVEAKAPKFKKWKTCLTKAETLALVESDYNRAGRAAFRLSKRTGVRSQKRSHLKRSLGYYEKSKALDEALIIAQEYLEASRSFGDKLEAEIANAKILYKMGDETTALQQFNSISKRLRSNRLAMGKRYEALKTEVTYHLTLEDQRFFDDYDLAQRSGSIKQRINVKAKMFETLARGYRDIADMNVSGYAARARYQMAVSAESFVAEIKKILSNSQSRLSDREVVKIESNANRLSQLAKTYYAENIKMSSSLALKSADRVWVNRSAVRLSSYGTAPPSIMSSESTDMTISYEIPQVWSY
jgi:hypothetical protein